jgi:membrane-bound lytic murein transglycosylase MltF
MKNNEDRPVCRQRLASRRFLRYSLVVAAIAALFAGHSVFRPALASSTEPEALVRITEPFTGDLDEIVERRVLRVLVTFSRSNYFLDMGTEHGFEYELLGKYGEALNQGRPLSKKVIVVFVPVPFERLLSDLEAGRGDIAAAGLTVTPQREQSVAFTRPYIPKVDEVVVSGPGAPSLSSLDDLSGQTVWVRAGSSYANHLSGLSAKLTAAGKKAIDVSEAPENLATEDILEMINAGVFALGVADRHVAEPWATTLDNLRVHRDLVVHTGGSIAWAVRKNNPKLRADLDSFIAKNKKGTLLGNILFNRYFKDSKWISNPVDDTQRKRLEELGAVFQKYGEMYGFDWLALAAVGYQESRLEQNRRSKAGAVGIMQMKPSTAADKNVNVTPIDTVDKNVHAGAKYLAFLRDRYFADPAISDGARLDFTLAAYNAGPARIASLRREAEQKGYDPNRWFFNVETIAAARVGSETVRYVANINKYYLAYSLVYRNNLQRDLQKQSLGAAPRK